MQARGVDQFVYTNADRDGMLNGADLDEVRAISEVIRGRFIYSGGIGSLDHLRALAELRLVNLAGVIAGKSLYEGKFTIAEAHEALEAG
jgi:phosphoribosylformimino-5-aminoimidazole carboxamide ribotide isomerase